MIVCFVSFLLTLFTTIQRRHIYMHVDRCRESTVGGGHTGSASPVCENLRPGFGAFVHCGPGHASAVLIRSGPLESARQAWVVLTCVFLPQLTRWGFLACCFCLSCVAFILIFVFLFGRYMSPEIFSQRERYCGVKVLTVWLSNTSSFMYSSLLLVPWCSRICTRAAWCSSFC